MTSKRPAVWTNVYQQTIICSTENSTLLLPLPVVHDELDAVPEGEGVAGVDDEPHDTRTHRCQGAPHDARLPRIYQLHPWKERESLQTLSMTTF
jgi:hypothetical protein